MKKRTIGFLTLLTAASASIFALAQGTPAPKSIPTVTDTPSPMTADVSQPCAYMWAYQPLPEISTELQAALQAVLPEAEARASAYGEDCVAADGSSTFGALETDFYVSIPVQDLTDNGKLGNLVEQVLSVVDGFPPPRVPGGQDGFVEFTFVSGSQQRILRVPIPLGRQLREQGLHGAELLQALETP
jgi:hypothetical protein